MSLEVFDNYECDNQITLDNVMQEENALAEQSRAEQSRAEQSRAEQLDVCRIGNLFGFSGGNYAGNVFDTNYISPTLTDMQGGGRQPHIVEVEKMESKQPKIKIRQATKDGFIECEVPSVVDLNYETSTTRRGRVQEGGRIVPAITTENIPSVIELGDKDFYNFLYEIDGEIYLIRIRKLTPKECWRLMDFSDEDFKKAEKVNSNTQLYKEAGNSIVKNCLVAIFGQMFEGKENFYKNI